MNILLFVVGSSTILHQQAHYALRALHINSRCDDKLFILTDSPTLYYSLPFVEVCMISDSELNEWRGKHGYFYRIKINAIRNFAKNHPNEHLVFVDCDTYCYGDLSMITDYLDHGLGVMHKDECSMEVMKGPCGEMWKQTKGRKFANITITNNYHMWNSGVVGIPRDYSIQVMEKALEICDSFLSSGITCWNMEQWAIAIALSQFVPAIKEADNIIGHYWHHKYVWSRFIAIFFTDSYAHGMTLEDELNVIRKTNFKWLKRRLATQRLFMKVFCSTY